uniref:Uncharacterized protein n=1 Tax=Anopheles quadriannulatus TaxID=34691 RepID=A0A182XRW9_ANOQN
MSRFSLLCSLLILFLLFFNVFLFCFCVMYIHYSINNHTKSSVSVALFFDYF